MVRLFLRVTFRKDRHQKELKIKDASNSSTDVDVIESPKNIFCENKALAQIRRDNSHKPSFSHSKNNIDVSLISPQSPSSVLENTTVIISPRYARMAESSLGESNDSCHICGESSDEEHRCSSFQTTLSTCSSSISGFSLRDSVKDEIRPGCLYNQVDNGNGNRLMTSCLKGKNAVILKEILKKSMEVSILSEENKDDRHQLEKAIQKLDLNANISFVGGMYDEAIQSYEKSLDLKRKTINDRYKSRMTSSLHIPPKLCSKICDMIDCESLMMPIDASVEKLDENTKSMLASVAVSLNNLSYLKHRKGYATAQDTLASYLESLRIKCEILGRDHVSVGKTLNNIGSIFYLQRDYQSALVAYEEAFRIIDSSAAPDKLEATATVLSNIGDVYTCFCGYTSALDHYRRALSIRWRLLGPSDVKVIRLMEQIAMLEMKLANHGLIQPIDYDDSMSDGEEFLQEDQENHVKYLQEVNTLKSSVQADLELFDWMEQQATIDFLYDEAVLSREIRDFRGKLTSEVSSSRSSVSPDRQIIQRIRPLNCETMLNQSSLQADDLNVLHVQTPLEKGKDRISDTVCDVVTNLQLQRESCSSAVTELDDSKQQQPTEVAIRNSVRQSYTEGLESKDSDNEHHQTGNLPWYEVTNVNKMNLHQRQSALFVVRQRLEAARASGCHLSDSLNNGRPRYIEPTVSSTTIPESNIQGDWCEQNIGNDPCETQHSLVQSSREQTNIRDTNLSAIDKRKLILELYKERKVAGKP